MALVLVIDDDPSVRSYLAAVLEANDHSIILCKDGREGMAGFKSHQIDLVITDIVMPVREGIETIREIRLLNPVVPILAVSGSHTEGRSHGYLELAEALGATATLAKPFSPDQLCAIIDRLLGGAPAVAVS